MSKRIVEFQLSVEEGKILMGHVLRDAGHNEMSLIVSPEGMRYVIGEEDYSCSLLGYGEPEKKTLCSILEECVRGQRKPIDGRLTIPHFVYLRTRLHKARQHAV